MTFYLVRDQGRPLFLMRVDLETMRCFAYNEATGGFEFHPALTADFYVDGELQYEQLDQARVEEFKTIRRHTISTRPTRIAN